MHAQLTHFIQYNTYIRNEPIAMCTCGMAGIHNEYHYRCCSNFRLVTKLHNYHMHDCSRIKPKPQTTWSTRLAKTDSGG